MFSVSIESSSVPQGQEAGAEAAVRAIARECNEGSGAWVVAVGLVHHNSFGLMPPIGGVKPQWVVFVNPRGAHIAPSAEPLPHPEILNWYAGFLTNPTQPFCTFGYSQSLPRLPVH